MNKARFRLQIQDILARRLLDGRLALFLGAGVSMGIGMPSWPRLIRNLYWTKKKRPPAGKDLAHAAERFLRIQCNDRYSEYLTLVRRALYDGVAIDFSSLHRSWTIAAIGALAMSSKRGSAQVYTLNYDDAVERYLSYHGYICRPIFEERDASMAADVHVFHPHGFIPSPGSQYTSLSKKIILDRRSYSRALGDIEDWWGQQMQAAMESHFCLFVGLSGEDQRFDALLVKAQERRGAASDGLPYWGVNLAPRPGSDLSGDWESRDICVHDVGDFKRGLGEFLFAICQRAAQARMTLT